MYASVCFTNHTLLEQRWDESPESKNRSFLAAHSPGNLRPTVIQFHNKVLHFKFDKRLGKNPARSNVPASSHDGLNFTAFLGQWMLSEVHRFGTYEWKKVSGAEGLCMLCILQKLSCMGKTCDIFWSEAAQPLRDGRLNCSLRDAAEMALLGLHMYAPGRV